MASSNPFRKKSTASPTQGADRFPPLNAIDTSVSPPPMTSFYHSQLPDPPAGDRKTKPVKKVRVLSPPPLSPDSPVWAYTPPSLALIGSQPRPQNEADPFEAASTDDSDRDINVDPPQNYSHVPANPFSKTLKDLEGGGATKEQDLDPERRAEGTAFKASSLARRSLDVNSFKRLLMTGNSGSGTSPARPVTLQSTAIDEKSVTKPSPVGQVSTYDSGSRDAGTRGSELHETSLISHEAYGDGDDDSVSDSSTSIQVGTGKKPPPPPSSRHGKSITLQLKSEHDALGARRSRSPTDVNKPLPPAPVRSSFDDDPESPFDQESAGKWEEGGPCAAATTRARKGGEQSSRGQYPGLGTDSA
ncbi:hypothetical protein G7046_g8039 [Stylonectria norvegica]|nr:hypothetical protein G7046_g8039 [Stylonectria norvegica]